MKNVYFIVLIGLLIFSSCSNSNKLVGCWQDQNSKIIIFEDDGTLQKGYRHGTWELIDEDRLSLKWEDARSDTHTIVKITSNSMVIKYNGFLEFTWA